MRRWFRRRPTAPVRREVTVYHQEYYGTQVALWFPASGSDEDILGIVERAAHPFVEPVSAFEKSARRELLGDYRTLTYGSFVRIGTDTFYILTVDGWTAMSADEDPRTYLPKKEAPDA